MNKYLLIGTVLAITIIVIGGGVYFYSNGQNNNTTTLGVKSEIRHLNPSEFNQTIQSKKYQLIDIRTDQEYATGHIAGAAQSDFYKTQDFSNYLDSLDKNKKYLIYCRTGHRSGQALSIMQNKGFTNVSDLAGGYSAWTASSLPTEQ